MGYFGKLFTKKVHLFITVLIVFSLPTKAYSGDLMNVEFLQKHAILADGKLQKLSQELAASKQDTAPSTGLFIINAVANGLFTATYFTPTPTLTQSFAGIAGAMFHYPSHSSYLSDQKSYKQSQTLVKEITNRSADLNALVESFYYDWQNNREGWPEKATEAKENLIKLTNFAVVKEVETSLALEALVSSRQVVSRQQSSEQINSLRPKVQQIVNKPQQIKIELMNSSDKSKAQTVSSQVSVIDIYDIGVAPLAFMKPNEVSPLIKEKNFKKAEAFISKSKM